MATQPTLYARMELSLTEAEKRLAKFNSSLDKSMGTMERRTAKASATMERSLTKSASNWAAGVSKNALVAAAAMLSFTAVIAGTKSALDAFGDIADKSAQSGLDPETFQELAYQASLAGVGIDDLSGALNTFSKNAGLAVVGKGKMVTALKALNPALLENIRNATNQAERVKLAADAIDQAKTSSEKAALSTALFGANLVGALQGGSRAMEETAARAQALGIVIDSDLIARADELGDQFDTASKVIDIQFKSALVNLAPTLVATISWFGQMARALGYLVDNLHDFNDQSEQTLEFNQAKHGIDMLGLEQRLLELKEQQKAGGILSIGVQLDIDDAQKKFDKLKAESAEIATILNAKDKARAATGLTDTGTGGDKPSLPPIASPSSSTRNKAAEDAVKQAEAVKKLIDNLEFEQSLVGKSEVEQAKMNALREAGAAATTDQKAQIESIIDATYREKAAQDAVKQSLQESAELGKDLAHTLVDGFRNGASAGELLTSVLDKIISKIIDMQINGLFDGSVANSGGGILGSLFKPLITAFSPTPVTGGTPAAANVANAVRPASALASSAQRVHVTVGIASDGNGNLTPFVESVADRRIGRHTPRIVNAAVSKSQASMPKWADEYQKRAG